MNKRIKNVVQLQTGGLVIGALGAGLGGLGPAGAAGAQMGANFTSAFPVVGTLQGVGLVTDAARSLVPKGKRRR